MRSSFCLYIRIKTEIQKASVSEALLAVDQLKIDMLPWGTLKTYSKNVMAKAWADDLCSKNLKSCVDSSQAEQCQLWVPQAEVYDVPHRISNGKFGPGKQNQHMSNHDNGCCQLLSPFPPSAPFYWKDMKTVSCGVTCRGWKWHLWDTSHGEAEMFWSVSGKADGNLKKMFLYVLRCHSAWLMDRTAGGRAAL